jgi:hypothetical protein
VPTASQSRAGLNPASLALYRQRPDLYAKEVVGTEWPPRQREIALALLLPPHRVMVLSANNQGKTHVAGGRSGGSP